MTKDEFNKLGVGTILLAGHNFVKITKIHEDKEHFDGILYTPYPLNIQPQNITDRLYAEVDFFDINENQFVADCIRMDIPITYDGKEEYTVHQCVDVICEAGLVKYFSISNIGIGFIGSTVRYYKNIKGGIIYEQ